jgi:hypothetical protein
MKSKFYILLICILVLTGCAHATPLPRAAIADQIDRSLFTGNPCAAPCWHGLEVGRSSESEVMSTVQKLNYIDQDTVQITRNVSGVQIIASCASPAQECLKFDVANDVLTKIVVDLNYDMRVDEAIQHLGDPHYLGVSAANGDIFACEVYMIWRNSGLVLASPFAANSAEIQKYCDVVRDTGKVPSSLLITEARLISGIELVTLLTSDTRLFSFSGTLSDQ